MISKRIGFKKVDVKIYKYNNINDYRMVVLFNGQLLYDIGTNYSPITKYSCLLEKCIFILKYLKSCKKVSEKTLLRLCKY